MQQTTDIWDFPIALNMLNMLGLLKKYTVMVDFKEDPTVPYNFPPFFSPSTWTYQLDFCGR